MKRTKKALLASLLVFPILSSCYFFRNDPGDDGNYPSPGTYPSGYTKENLNIENVGRWNGQVFMPATGESSILVIPVQFEDDTFTQVELERIQNGFFGESTDTYWESVKSYYEKASYGNLEITGAVTEPLTLNKTTRQLSLEYATNSSVMDEILTSALETLYDDGYDFADFDSNGDHFIDAVWFVYSAPYDTSSDLYWAFTTWATELTSVGGYYASSFSWASVNFLVRNKLENSFFYKDDGDPTNADSHTFIHETGHLMGLDDYYSYDSGTDNNTDSPMGGTCMMDYNIGDHDAYSKYVLDWIDPIVITKDWLAENGNTLTLRSFGEYGEAAILPLYSDDAMNYNETPFDEYLILEYYTPDLLNQQDATTPYENMKMFTESGLLVYHVDSRIGRFVASQSGVSWDGYCYDAVPEAPDMTSVTNSTFYYLYSNTRSYSQDTSIQSDADTYYKGRLVSLLGADERKTRMTNSASTLATDKSLFQEGDSFFLRGGVYKDFAFDDGTQPFVGFEVQEADEDSCVLVFQEA